MGYFVTDLCMTAGEKLLWQQLCALHSSYSQIPQPATGPANGLQVISKVFCLFWDLSVMDYLFIFPIRGGMLSSSTYSLKKTVVQSLTIVCRGFPEVYSCVGSHLLHD